ncbi:MAG: OsmC family protein [Gemmatimonadota bacterium]|nr:MAG: OsmC family protein [Gemmatimonadota bacterium]
MSERTMERTPVLPAAAVERIRTSVDRGIEAMKRRDSVGRGTAVTKVRMVDGLTCRVEDGAWSLTVDMPGRAGGNDAGPNPGVIGRGALGSCLAIAYGLWAARRGVPIDSLEVEVQADYDVRGQYGLDENIPVAYSEIRYVVSVRSDAPEHEVLAALEDAEAHCVYLKIFTEPQRVCREVRFEGASR